ncbi:MAG TPA: CPBP family intramembrane metalloprotease [Firmicutes bacterium]|nr:CPBP family intramembrane metalloprotease [Bacillota bacterium]
MNAVLLGIGIVLGVFNMVSPKALRTNIIRRLFFILVGVLVALVLDRTFLRLSGIGFLWSTLLGLSYLITHLVAGGGSKLRRADIDAGLPKTILLLYLVELPGEEFLYRLTILLPARELFGSCWAIFISTLMFSMLHLKTWNKRSVWIGSTILGLSCGIIALLTNSILAAVIVHNLNNFALFTLIGKRNVFQPGVPAI